MRIMHSRNTHPARKHLYLFIWVTLLLFTSVWSPPIRAQESTTGIRAEIDCVHYSPCKIVEGMHLILHKERVVHWYVRDRPEGEVKREFYLATQGGSANADRLLSKYENKVDGYETLPPGSYLISVNSGRMGTGKYYVDVVPLEEPSIGLAISPSDDFGQIIAGGSSSPHTVTITYMGPPDRSAGITEVKVMEATEEGVLFASTHFQIISPSVEGTQVPPARTFQLIFSAGNVPGVFTGYIFITGWTSTSYVHPRLKVTGTTVPKVPDIACNGSCDAEPILSTADRGEVKTFTAEFQNKGLAPLNLSSITVVSDVPGVFSLGEEPSTALLEPNGRRAVQVRFSPNEVGREFCGHLLIRSDDPDEPVKSCYFRARGYHPVPRMSVEPSVINYRGVELGFAYTRSVLVRNDGDAPLTVTVSDDCGADAACVSNQAQWPSRETGTFVIPSKPDSGTSLKTFRMTYSPRAAGAHSIRMRVTGNDPTNPSQSVTLMGEGLPPIPIDSVLVLDRSGSMSEFSGPQRKIDALQRASHMFVHLLRPEDGSGTGDRVGLVRYNNENDVYLPLDFLTPTHLTTADEKLSEDATGDTAQGIGPTGQTGIGGAMQRAAGMFPPPTTERKHVMVVLTDGIENQRPYILDVLNPIKGADPNLKIYSVGIGRDDQINADKLQKITGNTPGAFHQVTDDLSGPSRFELESFYFKIFSNATGRMLVVDPTTAVDLKGTGPVVVNRARIVSSDHNAVFVVLDDPDLREYYRLELLTPSGQVVGPDTTVGGVAVHLQQRYNYVIYKVVFPDESQASSYVGDWVLRLVPNGRWSEPAVRKSLLCFELTTRPAAFSFVQRRSVEDIPCVRHTEHGDEINPFKGLAPVGFGAAVGSDYRMEVRAQPSHLLPTADVKLTASLSDRGVPSPTGNVFVDVTTPGKTLHRNVRLFDDGTHGDDKAGDGTWTTHFLQTFESGVYKFFFHAVGANERGELAPREDTRYVALRGPKLPHPDDDDRPGKGFGRLWFSIHTGYGFPLDSFKGEYDPGSSLTFDLEYPFKRYLSLYGMLGYHRFEGKSPGASALSYTNLSLNLRGYFPLGSWRGFLQGGPGAYFPNFGSNKFGYNVGAGLSIPVRPKFEIEASADLHHVDPSGKSRLFLDPKLGIRFRF